MLLRGDPRRLAWISVAWVPLFLTAVVAQSAAFYAAPILPIEIVRALNTVSLWSLAAFAGLNRAHAGALLVALGSGLNAVATTASGGVMPVSASALAAAHGSSSTALHTVVQELPPAIAPIADIIPVALTHSVYSVGDIFVVLGVLAFVLVTMLRAPRVVAGDAGATPG